MSLNLETLDLTPEELEHAKRQVRVIAYHHWEEAGHPDDSALNLWLTAEREWICHQYVPDRHNSRSTSK
ncbi:MAG: DUF2934 domain-containing protein [Planctomycetes bacterium]|nr:DUF2934 domain-containing protein [Planctomycetota bacterium]